MTPVGDLPMDQAVQDIIDELRYYVPAEHIDSQYGILWQLENGVIDKPYLSKLRDVRRVQFLEGRISPDPEVTYEAVEEAV